MDRNPAARARGIRKSFGDVVALDGVDLDVGSGQVHGLVGPNGAGKTTLLGLLLGLAVADSGSLEILGTPVGRTLAVPDGVAGFVDGPGLYPSLTARQNLSALASLLRYDAGRPAGVDDALEQVGLTDVADDRVRGFSLGMRQRLGLAAALLTTPRLLVLDEPANGLDPAGKHQVHCVITGLAVAGVLPLAGLVALTVGVIAVATPATGSGIEKGKLQDSLATAYAHLYRLQTQELHRPDVTEAQLQATASCDKGDSRDLDEGPGNDWRCVVSWHLPGATAVGTAIYQLDVTADGRYVADGDGPKEVNGYFQVRTPNGDAPNPLWQFDGNVDLLTSSTKE